MLWFTPIVNAQAGGFGAFVRAGAAAIELALTHHALAGRHRAVAAETSTFGGLCHNNLHIHFGRAASQGQIGSARQLLSDVCDRLLWL